MSTVGPGGTGTTMVIGLAVGHSCAEADPDPRRKAKPEQDDRDAAMKFHRRSTPGSILPRLRRCYAVTLCRASQSSRSLSRSTLPRSLFGRSGDDQDLLRRLGRRQELPAVRPAPRPRSAPCPSAPRSTPPLRRRSCPARRPRRPRATPGCLSRISSISSGAMLTPPRMIRSLLRPETRTKPSASLMPRSPVLMRLPSTGSIEPSSSR